MSKTPNTKQDGDPAVHSSALVRGPYCHFCHGETHTMGDCPACGDDEEQMREIRRLNDAIRLTLEEQAHLADGDNCTLIRLKRALHPNSISSP